MKDDACDGVFGVGVDRTAFDAFGAEAVVATHGEVEAVGVGIGAAFNLSDAPPAEIGGRIVLLVASDLAGAAADTLRHIEVEAVLLAWRERAVGDECGLYFDLRRCEGKEFDAILRQAHDGACGIVVREFVEWESHRFPRERVVRGG